LHVFEFPLLHLLQLPFVEEAFGELHTLDVVGALRIVLLAFFVQLLLIVAAFELSLHQQNCAHLLHIAEFFQLVAVFDALQQQIPPLPIHNQQLPLQTPLLTHHLLPALPLMRESLLYKPPILIDLPLLTVTLVIIEQKAGGIQQTPLQPVTLSNATLIVHNYNEDQYTSGGFGARRHRARYLVRLM
jgi:hypothetical protein